MQYSYIYITVTIVSLASMQQGVQTKKRRGLHTQIIKKLPMAKQQPSNATSANVLNNVILCRYYTPWSNWSRCNRKCEQSRVRTCNKPAVCGRSFLKEKRRCKRKRGQCSALSYKVIGFIGNTLIDELLHDRLYANWSKWGRCTRSCRKRRYRRCKESRICGKSYIQQEKNCKIPNKECEVRYNLRTFNSGEKTTIPGKNLPRKLRKSENGAKSLTTNPLADISKVCGIRTASRAYRIVGGREALRNSWPWQVAILTRRKEQYCGGTMIAHGWVLTAAHCIRKRGRKRKVIVRVGEHNIHDYSPYEVDMKVERDFPHRHFNYQTITNDIALLKLRKPHRMLRKKVGYACLPEKDYVVPDGTGCKIVGWGKESMTEPLGSEVLLEASVPIVNKRTCRKAFDYKITDKQVCAGYKSGVKDSCAGDSGGPLLCPRTENGVTRWFVYGVTSYGEGCGQKNKFGIYTRVTNYLKWINRIIAHHS